MANVDDQDYSRARGEAEGDNMAQTEMDNKEWYIKCRNCKHVRMAHFHRDGCDQLSEDSDPEVNYFLRCHCTNFEAVKE